MALISLILLPELAWKFALYLGGDQFGEVICYHIGARLEPLLWSLLLTASLEKGFSDLFYFVNR